MIAHNQTIHIHTGLGGKDDIFFFFLETIGISISTNREIQYMSKGSNCPLQKRTKILRIK